MMRLINTRSRKFEQFAEKEAPPYAILSHTWGNDRDELSYSSLRDGKADKSSIGWTKLEGTCHQAEADHIGYVWIDTCCIDKNNGSELSASINSMFRWYHQAAVCYAYLTDVPSNDLSTGTGSPFHKSRWFTRGWTLQELVAPQSLRFYNSAWKCMGTKGTLCSVISDMTNIPRRVLLSIDELFSSSVAQRMSWAANRVTTKAEDRAYSLIGIFNVTMPMIYGEGGPAAFFRLQERIIEITNDETIFAWGLPASKSTCPGGAILASSPTDFSASRDVVVRAHPKSVSSIVIAGGCLDLSLPLASPSPGQIVALLNCTTSRNTTHVWGVPLVRAPLKAEAYTRPQGSYLVPVPLSATSAPHKRIHILLKEQAKPVKTHQKAWFYEETKFSKADLTLVEVEPRNRWDEDRALILPNLAGPDLYNRVLLRFRQKSSATQDFVVVLEQKETSSVDPQCLIMVCGRNTRLKDLAGDAVQMKMRRPHGERGASNGSLHLRVLTKQTDPALFIIEPERLSRAPAETLDATAELQRLH